MSPRARRAHRKAELRLWEKYGLTPALRSAPGPGLPPPSSAPGTGPPRICWALAGVGVGASGNGCKWEWAQVGMGASGNHAEAQVLCAVDGGARRPRAGDGGAAADVRSGDRPHSSAGRVLRGRATQTHMHTHARAHTQVLKRFQLPEELWSRLRKSRATRSGCPHLRQDWAHPLPHLHQERAHPCPHLCRQWAHPCLHLHWDWVHPVHICTGTALTATTSAPGVGSPLSHLCCQWAHPCLHLHRGWAHPFPHLRRDSGPTTR